MEFLDGQTLKHKIENRPLKLPELLQYGIQIADALDAAHNSGIVHLSSGRVKVGFCYGKRTSRL
jgi:serine/threonine protein kinase